MYSSTARVQVLPKPAQEVLAVGNGTSFANMDTEAALVTSARIRMQAADLLGDSGQDASLATDSDVSVSVPADTTLMDIASTTEQDVTGSGVRARPSQTPTSPIARRSVEGAIG